MRRKVCFGFVPLVCVLAGLLGSAPAANPPPGCGCASAVSSRVQANCNGKVCPLYLWAHYQTYCSYYAIICPSGGWVNYDAACGLAPNSCVLPCASCDDPGMKTSRSNARSGEPCCQFPGEENVAELGAPIGPEHRPIVRLSEGIEVEAVAAMRLRGDGDDPRWRGGLEAFEQQISQQERRQMIDREGQLEPIERKPVFWRH